ncbi:MAG: hypothetical protein AAFU80_08805 [Pseudomonadota bacterium]
MSYIVRFALFITTFIGISFLGTGSFANSVVWDTRTIEGVEFDCRKEGIEEILIKGIVRLQRNDDVDLSNKPKLIKLTCPLLRFDRGAEIQSSSELLVAVDVLAGDEIVFRSTRGQKGANAAPTPNIWKPLTAPQGRNGRSGRPNGEKTNAEICKDGRDGGRGEDGDIGQSGRHGQKGAPGKPGLSGSRITVAVGSFETGDEVLNIHTEGGDGGAGGKGGRGENGGKGGTGGPGGRGGNAECGHRGANGGPGGNGGDGGRGGNGGAGGDGGNGGAGGDITFGLKQGGTRPAEYNLYSDGGRGGAPGLGGDKGTGGEGGGGGAGGGAGKGWFENGGPGNDGLPGNRGEDGMQGPLGEAGLDGPDGAIGGTGTWEDGPITPSILEELKNLPVG